MDDQIPKVTPTLPEPGMAEEQLLWPAVAAKAGVVYGFLDPNHGLDTPMAAMTLPTWEQFSRQLQMLKSRVELLAQENLALKQGRHPEAARLILPNR